MNAFNLIDGIDGLAAGSALFSTVAVFIVSLLNGRPVPLLLTAVLSGALLGFLRFNFNPATIFLGDSGSLFIGFMLAALSLGGQKAPTVIAVSIPVVAFGLPILETVISVLRRFLNGKPLMDADRGHFHHQLLKRGLSQRQVVLILYAASGAFALMSLLLLHGGNSVALLLIVFGGVVWVALQRLGYHEFGELRRVAQRTIEQKRVIINNLAIRRGSEDLAQSSDFPEICAILERTFRESDFDGFEFCYTPLGAVPARTGPSLCADGEGVLAYQWPKSPRPAFDRDSSWDLRLSLVLNGRRVGELLLHRLHCDRPLMIDVNLLTPGFVTELARALDRAYAKSVPRTAYPALQWSAAAGMGRTATGAARAES
jgi:UDP-GlcNAc:undecaprenyl-phosphate GlcNAc-1-phosphate transferase